MARSVKETFGKLLERSRLDLRRIPLARRTFIEALSLIFEGDHYLVFLKVELRQAD